MVSLLRRDGAFRLLLSARLVSSLGDWFTYTLLVVLAYARTGRAADAMLILASQAVATLLFSVFAGPLADRRHPVKLMAAADLVRVALVGALFVVPVSPAVYAGAAFLTAGAAAYFNPAEDKWVMLILPQSEYSAGAALRQLVRETTKILGPSLAVTVIAFFGAQHRAAGFLLDAGSFLLSALLLLLAARRRPLGRPPAEGARSGPPWREWRGLGPTLALPAVRTLSGVLLAVLFGLGGIEVVLLAFVHENLHLSALDFGYLITALSLGIIAGTLTVQRRQFAPWIWLAGGVGGLGLFFGLTPLAPTLALGLASMAVVGVCNGVVNVNLAPYLQTIIPVEVAGRFYSLLGTLASLAAVIGMAFNSALLSALGPGPAMGIVGGWIALAGLVGALRMGRARSASASADANALG